MDGKKPIKSGKAAPKKEKKAASEKDKKAKSPFKELPPTFKPAKYGLQEKQIVDYVRTATAKNIWYYR
jgi:hypothetical protein